MSQHLWGIWGSRRYLSWAECQDMQDACKPVGSCMRTCSNFNKAPTT